MTHTTGTYVALELHPDSRDQLSTFVTDQLNLACPVDPDYYHTTVIYSAEPVPAAESLPRTYTALAQAVGYTLFTTKTGHQCLTLLIESAQARAMNWYLMTQGAVSAYPTYTPHLTLSYNYSGPDPADLPVPTFAIHYDRVMVKPLDPTFVPPTAGTAG